MSFRANTLTLLAALLLGLVATACSSVSSNLPSRITDQIVRDWRCEDMHGTVVGHAPRTDIWRIEACGRTLSMTCPHGAHSRWRRCRYGQAELTVPAQPSTAGGAVRVADPGSRADAYVRGQIDARAPAILGCTSGRAAVLDVAWRGDRVRVRLAGEPARSAAQGCVQAALAPLAFPPGSAGRLRHVLSP